MVLGGLVAAGAWAAFLSTASGLVVSVAGVLVTDVLRGARTRDLRVATVLAAAVPLGLALGVDRLDFTEAVALVFAVAASTFCPLLVLGIWWRRLTDHGAVAGVLAGGVLSTGAVAASLVHRRQGGQPVLVREAGPAAGPLLLQRRAAIAADGLGLRVGVLGFAQTAVQHAHDALVEDVVAGHLRGVLAAHAGQQAPPEDEPGDQDPDRDVSA